MSRLFRFGVVLSALLALGSAPATAATFNYTVNCPTDTVVGPVTVLASTISGSLTLTQGVIATQALLPTNNLTRVDDNAAAGGTYTGTLNCTLTLAGVTTNFSRSFSLDVPPLPSPPNASSGLMTTGSVSFTMNLGPQGIVDIAAPVDTTLGYDRGIVNGGFIIVPHVNNTTLLLHDVPGAVAVPLPGYLVLNLIGMIMLGLYLARRGRRN